MKRHLFAALAAVTAPAALAIEVLRWERLPLAVPLVVGQERVVFIDRDVRVGVPTGLEGRLHVQSAGGAVYLHAIEPIESTRLQLQDADTGALILLDVTAQTAREGEPALEPVRIVEGESPPAHYGGMPSAAVHDTKAPPQRETPIPAALTRYAAQSLYAPLRTVEPVPGIARVSLRRDLALDRLLPTYPISATALAAWRLNDMWVTAVRFRNTGESWLTLDPRALQGDFVAATFQHAGLGPRGTPEDTTVLYLVTRGRGLAQSQPPAINRIDPAAPLSAPPAKHDIGEVRHAR